MSIRTQEIRIANHDDSHGALLFSGEFLIAVFSRLSSKHDDHEGWWYMECGFGAAADSHQEFSDLESAKSWIEDLLVQDRSRPA